MKSGQRLRKEIAGMIKIQSDFHDSGKVENHIMDRMRCLMYLMVQQRMSKHDLVTRKKCKLKVLFKLIEWIYIFQLERQISLAIG